MQDAPLKTPSIFGGILLVLGNVVGTGILALPLAIAQLGLPLALLVLFVFWLIMMLAAYYFLEANLFFPAGSNLISMARGALGRWGVVVAWIANLVVMYSLIAAYISGGGDLIKQNLSYLGFSLPEWACPVIFLLLFGGVVVKGIRVTDYTNRLLMLFKAATFLIILMGLSSSVGVSPILMHPHSFSGSLFIVGLTSFGFAIIIPSLRHYYHSDLKKIKKIIFWGTFIPLLCYIFWITLIFLVIPYEGIYGLKAIAQSTHPVSDLQNALRHFLGLSWLVQATNLFSAVCILTSFLANSISFTDFMADGFKLHDGHKKKFLACFIAYIPALCAVLFYPRAFLMGLSAAGSFAVIQLLLLPVLIIYFSRYVHKHHSPYRVFGGVALLAFMLITGFVLLGISLIHH